MAKQQGSNLTNIKLKNITLILKLISTEKAVSRVDLSRMTSLTNTTSGNIVSKLLNDNIICECNTSSSDSDGSLGRRPILLDISPSSPLVMGMLIKRRLCTAILADFKGRILDQVDYKYQIDISADQLIDILMSLHQQLRWKYNRPIIAIGLSSIGPVDIVSQKIVNPPNFFGINNLPIVSIIKEKTGLPTFLINDSNAGALAEKIYGSKARHLDNLIYLHIMNGIGTGYVLNNKVYNGDIGQSGEIGHTSINFSGPVCTCGNIGCLELYANMHNVNRRIHELQNIYNTSSYLTASQKNYTWNDVLYAANKRDLTALSSLEEFCDYISYALTNVINLLDINHIIVGYDALFSTNIIEDILRTKLNSKALTAKYREIFVEKSTFGSNAPLIGSIAVVTDKIFNGEFQIFPIS